MIAVVKESLSVVWAIVGLLLFSFLLLLAILLYKKFRGN
jgi:hypothetical protein